MKKNARILLLAFSVVFVMSLFGCQEEQLPNTKKCRLIADENMTLKEQLKERDKEIESQQELLKKCQKTTETLKKSGAKEMEKLLQEAFSSADTQKSEQIQALQKRVQELEEQLQKAQNNKP